MSRGLVCELARQGWPMLIAQLAVKANTVIDTILTGGYAETLGWLERWQSLG
ncbi:MAG: hypothetical protein ACTS6J_17860 [Burkholderiales bacterium]